MYRDRETETFYPFLEMSCLYIKQKDIHKISVIFRLFMNLLRINFNKSVKKAKWLEYLQEKKKQLYYPEER